MAVFTDMLHMTLILAPRESQAAAQAALTATVRYREPDIVGGPITQLL